MFSDPINFIDPNGEIWVNLVSAVVGAYLGYDNAASDPCATTESKIRGALLGAITNLFKINTLSDFIIGATGNFTVQINNPSNNHDVNWSQVVVAGVLTKIDVGGAAASKVVPQQLTIVAEKYAGQRTNNEIVNRF